MRWLVDVTRLGNGNETETVQVDADSWQNALLIVRTRRGESGPLSGFSIELLEGGECRALDPASHVRYDVRTVVEREPAPQFAERSTDAATRSRAPPRAVSAVPPRPSAQPRAVSKPAAIGSPPAEESAGEAPRPPSSAAAPAVASGPEELVATAASRAGDSAPAEVSAGPQPIGGTEPPPTENRAAQPPPTENRAAQPPPTENRAAQTSDVDLVPSQIIYKREQERTPAQPLTYREYIYRVPQGTSDEAAERLLQRQLDRVRASLEQVPAGKLIHLAAFDVQFHGKPPVAPIATIIWKDWLGPPVVALPRRAGADPTATGDPLVEPAAAQHETRAARSPSGSNETARDTTLQASNGVAALETGDLPEPLAGHADPPAPVRPALAGEAGIDARRAARGEDLIADLFEAMHDLHFLRDAVEGGAFCLALCVEKIPCSVGVVHVYDIDRREYLATNTHGAAARQLLLRRTSEADPIFAAATRRRHAIAVTYTDENEARSVERYGAIGGARRVLVAPVMQAGRFLGALELVDPLDGQPFTETEANAVTYIASQFADFLAARGIVTDPERIAALVRSPG